MNKNNLSFILLSVLLSTAAFGFFQSIYSQEEIIMDSIITGNKYRITMYNDKEVIGKVVKQDSLYVYMVSETGTVRIRYEDIFSVSKSTIPRLMKAMFTLGGGIMLESGEYNYYRNNSSKPGFSVQLTGLFPFSENKAMRLDLSYGQFMHDQYVYTNYYYPENETYTNQTISLYQAYADFLFGDFTTASDFNVYGLAGLGLLAINYGSYDYTYYNYSDSTYTIRTNPSYGHAVFSLAIGGGLRFKLNNRLGVFAEAQYNISTFDGFFFFFAGRGYFPIRAGITYSIY
jgi:hypothetical protein